MNNNKVKKITVEFESGELVELNSSEHEFKTVFQRGVHRTHCDGLPDVILNGQQRVMIKAWKGCEDFDSFQAETSDR